MWKRQPEKLAQQDSGALLYTLGFEEKPLGQPITANALYPRIIGHGSRTSTGR